MKNKLYIIVVALCLFVGNFVFAGKAQATTPGVQTRPQSLTQSQFKLTPASSKMQIKEQPKASQISSTPDVSPPFADDNRLAPTHPEPFPEVAPVVPYKASDLPFQIQAKSETPTYQKLSMQEAIDYALKNSLDIKVSRLDVNKAKNDIKTANRLKNPYLVSFFNFGRAATDNPNSVGFVFPVDIAKRGSRKKLAKSNLELTKGNVALDELNLRLDVRQAYVDLVAAKSVLKILGDQRKLLQELLDVAQKKYNAGAVPEMDVIQAKMTLNQLLIQENSAKTDVNVARYNFNKTIDGIGYDTLEDYLPEQKDFIFLLTPKPMEKTPDFDKLLEVAIDKRLDLKNAKQEVDVAQKNLVVTVRQRIPDIEIGGGYMFVSPQLATSGIMAQGVYLNGNITNIPLLYQYSPEIKNAKIQVDQKELAFVSLKHKATMDLHSVYDEFNTAQSNLNYYNDILLSESNQFLGMAKRSYEVGKTNITNLIFIEQSYKSIIMGYTQALADYYDSWVDVLRQVNDEGLKLNE